mmetsp:Transcript_6070/g.9196  ORF Transcript_6070/g.9196 Transcript_6070/m.9196 type:complete len:465 (+) Transcript_6070:491-1885(+)
MASVRQEGRQMSQAHNADDGDIELLLHLLHSGGGGCLAGLLLSVQCQHHPTQLGLTVTQHAHRLPDRRARRDDVINHQHPLALDVGPHEAAPLAVVLGLLAVVGKPLVQVIVLGQAHAHCRHQRNALVGGAEEHVELDAGPHNRLGIVPAQLHQCLPRAEQTCVEKVRRLAPGLQRKLPKLEHLLLQAEGHELLLVREHLRPVRQAHARVWVRVGFLELSGLVDLVPQAQGRGAGILRLGYFSGDRQEETHAIVAEPSLTSFSQVSPLCPYTWGEYPHGPVDVAHPAQGSHVSGPHHQPHIIRLVPLPRQLRHLLVQHPGAGGGGRGGSGFEAVFAASGGLSGPLGQHRLQVRTGGVGGLAEHKHAPVWVLDERPDGVEPHVGRQRDGVRPHLLESGVGVGLCRGADVPSLGVQQHWDPLVLALAPVPRQMDHALEGGHAVGAQSLEERGVRLVRCRVWGRGFY